MGWKVVATQQGQYNQALRVCDDNLIEVFELLSHEDGTYPLQFREVPLRDEKTKRVIPDEFTQVKVMVKTLDGKSTEHAHRDFAEDLGNKLIKSGPKKGESIRVGWMKRVPDHVKIGIYPAGTDFWTPGQLIPPPFRSQEGDDFVAHPWKPNKQDAKRNHAPILEHAPREEPEEEAA